MSRLSQITKARGQLPPRVILYGTEGIGKTTWGASAPNPIIVQTEDGSDNIEVSRLPKRDTYEDVRDDLDELVRSKHDFKTVVVDSLDWLERLIFHDICQREGKSSIEQCSGGYGKGYKVAVTYWRDFTEYLDLLRKRGFITICLAHASVKRFEDPEHPAYDRYEPRLNKEGRDYLCEWADAVLFATRRLTTVEDKGNKDRTRAIGRQDERILRTTGTASCIAKNRYGISGDLPLVWDEFYSLIGGQK